MKAPVLLIALAAMLLTGPSPFCPWAADAEEFGGFGMVVAQLYDTGSPGNMGGTVILHVPQDSEAYKAGLRAGDVILEVDGRQTAGRIFGDVILNSLRGAVGSSADLKVKRAPGNEALTFRVRRTLVTYPPEKKE